MRFTLRRIGILMFIALGLAGCSKPPAEDMFQEAYSLMVQQNYVSARHRFEELIKAHPDFELIPEVRMFVADCYNFEQRPDDAEAIFKEIAEKYPNTMRSLKANIRLGDMAVNDKRYEDAVKYFTDAVDDSTGEADRLTVLNGLSKAYDAAGEKAKSHETLNRMMEVAKEPRHRLRVGAELFNKLIMDGSKEEAWRAIASVYDPKLTLEERENYFKALLQAAPAAGKYDQAFQLFNAVVESSTEDEAKSQASFFNGLLAASTETHLATGVAVLKRIHEIFPKTTYGRWSPVEAAMKVMSATDVFPNATSEVAAILESSLHNYDDIINDLTTEWFEPRKAAWGWFQVGTIHELRSNLLLNRDALEEASKTATIIREKFKNLPEEMQSAQKWQQNLAAKLHVSETSPEFYWRQIRMMRAGIQPKPPEAAGAEVAGATTASATTTTSATGTESKN
ncbi:MAG: tetratricopeptide repeat protein [Candidatus Omnitrophica bacterium]|nr:hypothetical protein [bacterium]NUN95181.1 tetratricopeptide repeat protein [Candidatus Omnitrophota bacterium]